MCEKLIEKYHQTDGETMQINTDLWFALFFLYFVPVVVLASIPQNRGSESKVHVLPISVR